MKGTSQRRIGGLAARLRGRQVEPPTDADAFWAEFRSLAGSQPVAARAAARGAHAGLRWAAAMASVAVAVGISLYALLPGSARADAAVVRALDVRAEYDSVMILQDAQNGGTIVWVNGIGAPAPEGG